jgi:hypothetical protein
VGAGRQTEKILHMLAEELQARGKLKLEKAFIDASFRGQERGPGRRAHQAQGTKISHHSLPFAVSVESASPHESQLLEGVLGNSFLNLLPVRLIGDKAYDSDPLDRDLGERYDI